MPFTVDDLRDFIRLLRQQPEWLDEVRRLVLTDEVLALPALVQKLAEAQQGMATTLERLGEQVTQLAERLAQLAERVEQLAAAQQRTEERLAQLEARLEQLAQAQQHTEERLAQLTERVEQLAQAQQRTEERLAQLEARLEQLAQAQQHTEERLAQLTERVEQLAQAQQRTEERLQQLAAAQQQLAERLEQLTERVEQLAAAQQRTERRLDRLTAEVGVLKGDALERRYRERAFAYFAPLVRRPHLVFGDELVTLLAEAVAQGALSDDEAYEIAQADVIVHGRRREDGTPVYLVVEVSWGVGPTDVQRARQRAALLAKLGTPTVPVVAGARITPAARRLAQDLHVQQLTNGQVLPPA